MGVAEDVIVGNAEEAVARLKAHRKYGQQMLLSRP
jgi:hypothetical protein